MLYFALDGYDRGKFVVLCSTSSIWIWSTRKAVVSYSHKTCTQAPSYHLLLYYLLMELSEVLFTMTEFFEIAQETGLVEKTRRDSHETLSSQNLLILRNFQSCLKFFVLHAKIGACLLAL